MCTVLGIKLRKLKVFNSGKKKKPINVQSFFYKKKVYISKQKYETSAIILHTCANLECMIY